jgi:queuine/archaeosine tRNA-ribosyltransferase
MTEPTKPTHAKYVPAGLYARQFMSDSSLYVKYLALSDHRTSISFEEKGNNHVILRLYDRDVHVVRNTHRLFDEDFDIHFNNSVFGVDNYFHREFGVDRVLMSAHNGLHELKRDRKDRWMPTHPDVKILGDSGGFQLRLGTTPYIDPNDVINWMNDFVDIGASLDIVPRPTDEGNKRLLFGLAEAQKRCNDIFLSKAREGLSLLNVVHGFTPDDARMWCDKVKSDDPRFVGWASGMDNEDIVDNLATALIPMLEYPEYAGKKGLHLFGISGKTLIPILIWMAKATGVPITMDSTNYLKGNRFRLFYFLDWRGKLIDVPMGRSAKLGYRTELPCDCPVCQGIHWCEAFHFEGGAKMQHMLTIHNLITTLRFFQRWNAIAEKSTLDEYKATVRAIYPKATSEGIIDTLDFVDICVKDGVDRALKEFHGKSISMESLEQDSSKKMEPLFPGEGPRSSHEDKPSMIGQKFLDSSARTLYRYIPKAEVNKLWEQEKKRKRKERLLGK